MFNKTLLTDTPMKSNLPVMSASTFTMCLFCQIVGIIEFIQGYRGIFVSERYQDNVYRYVGHILEFSLKMDDKLLHILTHWGRMTHTCVSKLTISGSDSRLSPDQRQAFIRYRNKMAAIFQTTISSGFIEWSLLPCVQLTTFRHWFGQWLGAGQATSQCLNQ